MQLLSFTVRNHKSIRDEITIDLVRPDDQVEAAGEDYAQMVYPVAGILGGNATGKSTILNALLYVFSSIMNSATIWLRDPWVQWEPFYLTTDWEQSISFYEIEFIYNNSIYTYGFEVGEKGIINEWLQTNDQSSQHLAFHREQIQKTHKDHHAQPITGGLSSRELILSRATIVSDSPLHDLARHLIDHFNMISPRIDDREHRLDEIQHSLADGTYSTEQLLFILQAADIGITNVEVLEESFPVDERIQRAIQQFNEALNEGYDSDQPQVTVGFGRPGDDQNRQVTRELMFKHRGASTDVPPFSLARESDGTIAWLILATSALDTIRNGGLLLVDEIDASLHPHLVDSILTIFSDRSINQQQAQLLFTTHDTYILSPLSEAQLQPEQIWLTNKSTQGVTTLSCLADFPQEAEVNIANRYLIGRYGGLPYLAPNKFANALHFHKN